MEVNPIQNPDGQSVVSGKVRSAGENIQFNAELATALKKNILKKGKKSKENSAGKKLSNAVNGKELFEQLDAMGTAQNLHETTQKFGWSLEESQELLLELKKNLMQGIKDSLSRLDKVIQDNDGNLDAELKTKYLKQIQIIREEFEKGFGISFDSADFGEVNSQKLERMIKQLWLHKDELPAEMLNVLESMQS